MYLDLDRLDVRAKDEQGDLAVQTDHRSAEEINADPRISALMMLTRVLNPQRGTEPIARVRLAMAKTAPGWFSDLARAAGAEVEYAGELSPASPDPDKVLQAASEALLSLGEVTFRTSGCAPNAAGLEELQHRIGVRVGALGGKEDPEAYWRAVFELGAATGWILVKEYGHSWVRDPKFFGTIPFMCGKDSSLSNVFDKVERFFRDGPSEAPTFLLSLAEDAALPDGQVMFNLRPHDWAGVEMACCWPVLEGELPSPVPVLALVHDTPNSVRTMGTDLGETELAEFKRQALENLAKVPFELEPLSLKAGEALVLEGDYFAAEKLFDPDFVLEIHARLNSTLLWVGIPAKGQAILFPRSVDPGFALALVEHQHRDTEPRNRISPLLFMFQEGKLVGLARPEDRPPEPEEQQKGFFARLFGGN